MSDSENVTGRCLCGAVTVHAQVRQPHVDACHCNMCQRWGGGPLMGVEAGDTVRLDGEERISVYSSSDWAERGFCRQCGTHLFYRLKEKPHYALPVGLLDAGPNWAFKKEIFVEEKPDFYDFANDTRRMTADEVIAEFGRP